MNKYRIVRELVKTGKKYVLFEGPFSIAEANDKLYHLKKRDFYIDRKELIINCKYLEYAKNVAKEATCGAVKVDEEGDYCAYSNADHIYAYLKCIKDESVRNDGSTLYLTHGVNPRHAMEIAKSGIARVVFIEEFGIGVGTALLRCLDVEVVKYGITC